MNNQEFNNWYNQLVMVLEKHSQSRMPSKEIARHDFDKGLTPQKSAKEFIRAWNADDEEDTLY